MSTAGTKRCGRCARRKPLSDYYVCSGKPHCYCKECFNDWKNVYRASWTKEQWAQHYRNSEAWRKRNRGRINAQARRRRAEGRPPRGPIGSVYLVPRGEHKGRLQLDYRDIDGVRHRALCPKGTVRSQAQVLLEELQAVVQDEQERVGRLLDKARKKA